MTNTQHRYPSFAEIEGFLRDWIRAAGDRATLAVEGRSPNNRPVYSITLTDPAAPAETKQNVLLSCVHSTERSAVAVLFAVMDWLLSSDPLAREVMRRQAIVCLPIVNPDGYVASKLDPDQKSRDGALYNSWTPTGVAHPDRFPEAIALQRVMDRLRPDLYADVHGVSLDFEGQLMLESSAASPTRTTNRPYHQQIARLMDAAALDGGFPSDFQEDDREVLYWDPAVDSLKSKLWTGRGRWSPGLYAYHRYHTLHVVMEITWQRSGLLRFQRLLRIGNETWEGEPCPGYPNRQDFLSGWPAGQNRPEAGLSVRHGGDVEGTLHADEPIRQGLALRMRIPYSKSVIRAVRLNGHPLAESDEDGYTLWRARGFTFVQANVPPCKSRDETLWILTCEYDTGETRSHWEFWAGKTAAPPCNTPR